MAKGLYNVIVSVFDGSLLSRNEGTTGYVKPIDFAALPAEFESLEAVAKATGRQVVIPGGSDDVLLSFSVHMVGNETLVIRSKYWREDGKQYTISQSLCNDATFWGRYYSAADNVVILESGIGIVAYLATMDDNTIYAEAFGEGYNLNISSPTLELDDLQDIIPSSNSSQYGFIIVSAGASLSSKFIRFAMSRKGTLNSDNACGQ